MDNLVNSLVTKTIGLTDQQIASNLSANPNMNDVQLSQFMQTNGVSPSQMSKVSGIPEGKISARVAATIPNGSSAILGDTVIVPQYRTTGSGMDEQIGALEGFATSKSNGDVNYKAPAGTPMQMYKADGQFVSTVLTKKDQSFFGGLVDAFKDPVVLAALGGAYAGGLFGGAATGATTFAGEALADASLLSGGSTSSLASLGADTFAGEALADASTLAGKNTALSSLGADTFAGEALADANTLAGGTSTAANTAGAATAANTTTAANAAKTGLLGLTTADALLLQAGGTLLGSAINKNAIGNASDIINQAGVTGSKNLSDVYSDQKGFNTANNTSLANLSTNLSGSLRGNLNDQISKYDTANTGIKNNATTQLNLLKTNLANQTTQANTNATGLKSNYDTALSNMSKVYDAQVGYQNPYQLVGQAGSKGLTDNQGYLTRQFGAGDLNEQLAPNYAFQLEQGQMANRRLANMGGGSIGGNALQGLQKYTQDYASGAYQNAFNNFNTQRQNIYSTLAGMANIGTTSGGQLASLGNTYGSNMGSLSSNLGGNLTTNTGNLLNAGTAYGTNTAGVTNNLNNVLSSNLNTLQGAYNQYGSNLTNAANNYGSNLTTGTGQVINAGNVYGTNQTGLTTSLAAANAQNQIAGANVAGTALNNLGNTALLSSLIKAT